MNDTREDLETKYEKYIDSQSRCMGSHWIKTKSNAFVLRWNPAISSYKMEKHLENVHHVKKMEIPNGFNWSVRDWQTLKVGDIFILLQVGTQCDGIAMIGCFCSVPYEEESWRSDGSKLHYADMEIFDAFNLEKEKEFRAENFEKDFPEIKWHGGHSGELLDEETFKRLFEKVEQLVRDSIYAPKKNTNV